jgi:uncharacterized protein
MADNTWILMYEYVDGMAEKRTPHRPAHLERIIDEREAGHLLIAGAYGETPRGGVFGFKDVDRDHVEAFADGDPYVLNGLVVKRTVAPWNLV